MAANQVEFWTKFKNHAETKNLLIEFNLLPSTTSFDALVRSVSRGWMKLAESHLKEAKETCSIPLRRAFYSRAYYAVYNSSKAVRYHVNGYVSSRGDDHQKVSELPSDFPDIAIWGQFLREMYQYRLIADYDGWRDSYRSLDRDIDTRLKKCIEFVKISKKYILAKYGVRL